MKGRGGQVKKKVLLGMLTGGLLSVTSIVWVFRDSPEENQAWRTPSAIEDLTTLGFQVEGLPSVSQKPLTVDEIARRLGFTDGQKALKAAMVLADRVKFGVLTKSWREDCLQENDPIVCAGIDDYFTPKLLPALAGTPAPTKKGRRAAAVPFAKKNIARLQMEAVNEQMRRISNWSWRQIEGYAELALKTKECPRNFSITLAREIEEHLKEAGSWALMDKLDAHGLACMKGDEPWAELIWQRVAFLKLGRNQYKEAIPLLEHALQANARKEENRSLYWLGHARKNLGLKSEANAAYAALWKSYPLGWHTILSRAQQSVDPLQGIREKTVYPDEYESGDAALDKRVHWLQLLMALNESPFVVRHYGEFVVKSFGPTVRAGFVQHLARLFNNAGLYRLQILALSNIVYSRPDTVTLETLRLLYPRPYFEELQQGDSRLDTSILLGLARQESGFDPSATSHANARGLMQLLPSTARSLHRGKAKKLYDYADNIALGSLFLMKLIKYFDGSVEKTLAAYNAGQTIVNKWSGRYSFATDTQLFLDLVPYRETREYVPSILRNAYWYHRLFPEMTKNLTATVKTSELLKTQLGPFLSDKTPFTKSDRGPTATSTK